ncbi:prepilin-type N-terminal cleavage/methylation domain-containing protein [Photobacterium japonica]|uniref:pilus assembly FimT family protein n=1 Tax=Photobacterium japonica TaxID=2910235 RepID=UPI003D0A9823
MAREMLCRLHLRSDNHQNAGGFTLLELLVSISVIAIMIAASAPSFSSLMESNNVKKLATEVEWLLVQAKSESVMRNAKLKVHYVRDDTNKTVYQTDGAWVLVVTDEAVDPTNIASAKAAAIAMVDGKNFDDIAMKATTTFVSHTIDPVRATSSNQGSYMFYKDQSKDMAVRMSQFTGRIRTCGISGDYYSYAKCN